MPVTRKSEHPRAELKWYLLNSFFVSKWIAEIWKTPAASPSTSWFANKTFIDRSSRDAFLIIFQVFFCNVENPLEAFWFSFQPYKNCACQALCSVSVLLTLCQVMIRHYPLEQSVFYNHYLVTNITKQQKVHITEMTVGMTLVESQADRRDFVSKRLGSYVTGERSPDFPSLVIHGKQCLQADEQYLIRSLINSQSCLLIYKLTLLNIMKMVR